MNRDLPNIALIYRLTPPGEFGMGLMVQMTIQFRTIPSHILRSYRTFETSRKHSHAFLLDEN